ncbi:MAG TPA: ArsB/NhaD family transporter [bacterium]|nr:ArsB/NhaD family transporter [bacterium]
MESYEPIFAIALFVAAFALIISEKVHRTKVVALGAALLLVTGIVPLGDAWREYIDFNTLGLLFGMMLIVNITKRTGVFEFVALRIARWSGGNYLKVMVGFSIITAVFSAFLDNVTTVLLIAPITLYIADLLGKSPRPLLIAEILASNIGGTATLIGDPPNILIGSAAGKGFAEFVTNLGPVIVVVLAVIILYNRFAFRRQFAGVSDGHRISSYDEKKAIHDKPLLIKCLVVLGLTIVAFMVHDLFGLPPAVVALVSAAVLAFITKPPVEELLREIEWPTLVFFAGLFVLVGGLKATGVTTALAGLIAGSTSSVLVLSLIILWGSAFLSAFLDNIPFVAAMIPLLQGTIAQLGLTQVQADPLWWALALGACLGGNGTLVGASANVIVGGISERTKDPITFRSYLKVGLPAMLISMVICSFYIYLRYFS